MGFYSTLADAFHDLVCDQLSDILIEYTDARLDTAEHQEILQSFNERMNILYYISRASTDFPPFLGWSDEQYERGYARAFLLAFLHNESVSKTRCKIPENERGSVIIEFLADIAKLNVQIKDYIILFSKEADENQDNEDIPDFISDYYPLAIVLHSMISD